jgi:peptidoglycan-associated lipoprotein
LCAVFCKPEKFVIMNLCYRFALLFLLVSLAACSGKKPPVAHGEIKVVPPAEFKAHPGLLGQPVPPELQPATPKAATETGASTEESGPKEATTPPP